MSDSDNYIKILEKISEVREDVAVLKSETQYLKEDMAESRKEISNIKDQDIYQNKLLDEHIQGVVTAHKRLDLEILARQEEKSLRDLQIKELNQRLEKAETIPNTIHNLKKFTKWCVSIAAGLTAIIELVKYLRHP